MLNILIQISKISSLLYESSRGCFCSVCRWNKTSTNNKHKQLEISGLASNMVLYHVALQAITSTFNLVAPWKSVYLKPTGNYCNTSGRQECITKCLELLEGCILLHSGQDASSEYFSRADPTRAYYRNRNEQDIEVHLPFLLL